MRPMGGKAPTAAWYRTLARAMKAAYAERLAGLGEVRADWPRKAAPRI